MAGLEKPTSWTAAISSRKRAVVPALAEAEQPAIDHMNDEHRDAIAVYARAFAGADSEGDWTLTGIDPDGMDLVCRDDFRRVFFPNPLTEARDLRKTLVEMAAAGRRVLVGSIGTKVGVKAQVCERTSCLTGSNLKIMGK